MLRSGCKTRAVRLLFGPTPPGLKSNHVLGFTSLVFWLKLPQPPSQCLIREGKKPKKGQQKRRKCLGKGDHVSLGEYHEGRFELWLDSKEGLARSYLGSCD